MALDPGWRQLRDGILLFRGPELLRRRLAASPLVAGGGVMCAADAIALLDLGAVAVEVGSVAIARPWRVKGIIAAINAREKSR